MERRALPLILASPLTWLALLIILGAEAAFYVWFQPPRLMFGVLCGVGALLFLLWPIFYLRSGDFQTMAEQLPYKTDVSALEKLLKTCDEPFQKPAYECLALLEKIQQEFGSQTFQSDLDRIVENLTHLSHNHLQLASRLQRFGTAQQKQLMQSILQQQVRSVENSLTTLKAFSGNLTLLEAHPEDAEKMGSDLKGINEELEHVIQKEA